MWVRMARFEGATDNWEERIETIRGRIRSPEGPMAERIGDVHRAQMWIDREGARGASVIYAESEEAIRRIDEAMEQMTPPGGGGQRSAVEIYEVPIDEQPGG